MPPPTYVLVDVADDGLSGATWRGYARAACAIDGARDFKQHEKMAVFAIERDTVSLKSRKTFGERVMCVRGKMEAEGGDSPAGSGWKWESAGTVAISATGSAASAFQPLCLTST